MEIVVTKALQEDQWDAVVDILKHGVETNLVTQICHEIVNKQQWRYVPCVMKLVKEPHMMDFVLKAALTYCQWNCVLQLMQIGLSPTQQQLVCQKALEFGHFDCAVELLRQGIDYQSACKIVEKAIRWNQCQRLIDLLNDSDIYTDVRDAILKTVKQCMVEDKDTHIMDIVLQAAISKCQWEFVLQLIQTGLTPAQQQLVCREALEFSHFDCAIELLRQGICYENACTIVWETIRCNQWQGLSDLLKDSGLCIAVRHAILKTAKQCMVDDIAKDSVNVYMKLLEASRPTETELTDVIKAALYDLSLVRIFQQLLVFKSARRLIKQIVLTTEMSINDVIFLHTLLWDQDTDLAFHLFVGQHVWENVVGFYEDPRLTARARRFALTHAISRRKWTAVQQMTAMKVTGDGDRRHAFLQAARLGEWRTALAISEHCVSLDCSDKVFAVRTWASLVLWQCVSPVLETWGHEEEFVNCVLQEAIIAGQHEVFVNVCSELDAEDVNSALIFRTALAHNKGWYVSEFCQCMNDGDILEMAIEFALKKEEWSLVKNLIKERQLITDPWSDSDRTEIALNVLLTCINGIVKFEEAWPIVVPEVNTMCKELLDFDEYEWSEEQVHVFARVSSEATPLLEFCLEIRHDCVALLLSVVLKNERNVQRALETVQQDCLTSSMFQTLFLIAAINEDWGSSTLLLQYISKGQAAVVVCGRLNEIDFDDFISKCRENCLFSWATYIGMWTGQWDKVRDDLEHCEDTNTVDEVIERAADEDEWDVVLSCLCICSQDPSLLCRVLCSAVSSGHRECCEMLIVKVNPLRAGTPLLYRAVGSRGDREDMVTLCIKAGLSTHLDQWSQDNGRYHFSPMRRVLHNGQLPLVKLLYRAGACSNGELQEYKNDGGLIDQLTGQNRQDIMEYMDFMASTPRSLQDLCRQKVSHCIGCQPSRSERVSSLGMSHVVCDIINFTDVLSS